MVLPARRSSSSARPQAPEPAVKVIAMQQWKKMNTKVARQNLPEDQLAWAENLQPVGPNQWQTVPGDSAALATVTGKTVTRLFSANIAGIDYVIFFATDGSATAVNANTGAQTTFAAPGTFSTTPDMTVYTSSRILIMDPTGGYATWDGTLFVQGGGLSPNIHVTAGGSLYATAPTVNFVGGNGQGATATAVLSGPIVVGSVTVTAPGSGYTTPPTVNFAGGGGSGAAATAVIGPFGAVTPNSVLSIAVTNGGSGYTSAPTINFTGGGGGTGAAATAVLSGGSVVAVNLTNPGSGYLPTDTVSVNFSGGGGSGATATVIPWPQVKGITLDVFAGRVWWASLNASGAYRILNWTGTAGYDDTNPANAAGSTPISDNDLSHNITAIRNRNNFLYIFGDSSIRQIGAITVSSSITNFTPLTLSSDIGTTLPMTIMSYDRLVLFANKSGVWGIFGSSIDKISDDLDGIFQSIDFTQELSAALNDIHSTVSEGGSLHSYLLLVRYIDPVKGTRSIQCVFQKNQWYIVAHGPPVKAICPLFLASGEEWNSFGSAGSDVTQHLQAIDAQVPILLRTSMTSHGNLIGAKQSIRAGVAATSETAQFFTMSIDTENGSNSYPLAAVTQINWLNNSGGEIQWQNNSLGNVQFVGGGFRFPYADVDGYGKVMGMTITGMVSNFSVNAIAIEYKEADPWGLLP